MYVIREFVITTVWLVLSLDRSQFRNHIWATRVVYGYGNIETTLKIALNTTALQK
jgi:hypothetical protein